MTTVRHYTCIAAASLYCIRSDCFSLSLQANARVLNISTPHPDSTKLVRLWFHIHIIKFKVVACQNVAIAKAIILTNLFDVCLNFLCFLRQSTSHSILHLDHTTIECLICQAKLWPCTCKRYIISVIHLIPHLIQHSLLRRACYTTVATVATTNIWKSSYSFECYQAARSVL